MASWDDLARYVRGNYSLSADKPGLMTMIFNFPDGRSQLVMLTREAIGEGSEEWVIIESAFAQMGNVSLQKVLERVGETVCGGAAARGPHIVFRHSVPLANLDINEFERPLALVTATADRLEQELFGGDKY
jgi:hypothetical protein